MLRWIAVGLTTFTVAMAGTSMADVLAEIAERGTIRLGIRGDAAPFSYLSQETEPSGLAVKLCEEVAGEIGREIGVPDLEIVHRVVTSSGRFNALNSGQTDLHCGPASATLKRRMTMDFSLLYYVDGAAVAARPGGYAAMYDTRQADVGVLEGTTTVQIAETLLTENNVTGELQKFPSHRRGLKALAAGDIDIYVGDQAILLFQIEELGLENDILVNEEVLSFEPYALVMKRGESALRLAVDRALSRIYHDGRVFDLIQDNLGDYPISPEVRAVYEIVGLPE
ncbi:MAG: amino acid ABC transporter substrate-binding protein [Pseudomonadota bacterium]